MDWIRPESILQADSGPDRLEANGSESVLAVRKVAFGADRLDRLRRMGANRTGPKWIRWSGYEAVNGSLAERTAPAGVLRSEVETTA
jgi:hypothetical protein